MPNLSKKETATILAALRLWQSRTHTPPLLEIATNCGEFKESEPEEIDALCERLNFDDSEALQTEIVATLAEVTGYLASARTDLKRTIAGDVFALQRMEWAEGAKEFAAKANALLEKIDDAK